MKGFSLVEVLIGLMLSMVIMAGLLQFSASLSVDLGRQRKRLALTNGLAMARDELMRMKDRLEPEFWQRFPPSESLFHKEGHFHGGVLAVRGCPDQPESDCLVYFDMQPAMETPLIYEASRDQFPEMLEISPIDTSNPPGASDALGPMSVLLFRSETSDFCALVETVDGGEIWLAPRERQPWPLPAALPEGPLEIVHLGRLSPVHLGLEALGGGNRKLVFRPWSLKSEGWSPGRRISSLLGRLRLIWLPCDKGRPDRLVVTGQVTDARPVRPPISIGTHTFQEEVSLVSLEF